jgi:hypothetical protein
MPAVAPTRVERRAQQNADLSLGARLFVGRTAISFVMVMTLTLRAALPTSNNHPGPYIYTYTLTLKKKYIYMVYEGCLMEPSAAEGGAVAARQWIRGAASLRVITVETARGDIMSSTKEEREETKPKESESACVSCECGAAPPEDEAEEKAPDGKEEETEETAAKKESELPPHTQVDDEAGTIPESRASVYQFRGFLFDRNRDGLKVRRGRLPSDDIETHSLSLLQPFCSLGSRRHALKEKLLRQD